MITFCKKNHLCWSFGRAKKQIADGLRYISIQTCQREGGCVDDSALLIPPITPTPLTCKGAQIIEVQNQRSESASSPCLANTLAVGKASISRDTFASTSTIKQAEKVSHFPHKSVARDHVLVAIMQYRGWGEVQHTCNKSWHEFSSRKEAASTVKKSWFCRRRRWWPLPKDP